jgi:hypothetical protein
VTFGRASGASNWQTLEQQSRSVGAHVALLTDEMPLAHSKRRTAVAARRRRRAQPGAGIAAENARCDEHLVITLRT